MKLQISIEVLLSLALAFSVAALLLGSMLALQSNAGDAINLMHDGMSSSYNAFAAFGYGELCFSNQNVSS